MPFGLRFGVKLGERLGVKEKVCVEIAEWGLCFLFF
jgi:hypothetical protein